MRRVLPVYARRLPNNVNNAVVATRGARGCCSPHVVGSTLTVAIRLTACSNHRLISLPRTMYAPLTPTPIQHRRLVLPLIIRRATFSCALDQTFDTTHLPFTCHLPHLYTPSPPHTQPTPHTLLPATTPTYTLPLLHTYPTHTPYTAPPTTLHTLLHS